MTLSRSCPEWQEAYTSLIVNTARLLLQVQDAGNEVNVLPFEPKRLADPHAGEGRVSDAFWT